MKTSSWMKAAAKELEDTRVLWQEVTHSEPNPSKQLTDTGIIKLRYDSLPVSADTLKRTFIHPQAPAALSNIWQVKINTIF